MRVLALEPFYGGSHRQFLEQWQSTSRHEWTLLSLPARHWKWRMRHASFSFAAQIEPLVRRSTPPWDVVFCSDMLNLAEWKGLVDPAVAGLPAVLYFHENQLTYPDRQAKERDFHFAITNLWSAAAASQVWFNSKYHEQDLWQAARPLLARMPDFSPEPLISHLESRSRVQHPPVAAAPDPPHERPRRPRQPLHIVWAARWEHDKDPEAFFTALDALAARELPFQISVLGERFSESPGVFDQAQQMHESRIRHWGFVESRDAYGRVLGEADVFVSTARHEFFGISAVEAMLSGCFPVLPNRLAYPELLETCPAGKREQFFYDDHRLAARLEDLIRRHEAGEDLRRIAGSATQSAQRFRSETRVPAMDDALETAART